MKKSIIFTLIVTLLLTVPFFNVSADIGPKRTLDVEVIGVDKPYYIELLMQAELPNESELDELRTYIDESYPEMFYHFSFEGYVSSNLILPWGAWHQNTKENYYVYSYNPPQEFKIMLLFEDGNYVISRRMETKLFNSKVIFDLTGVTLAENQTHVGKITEIFPTQTMTLELILRIIGTIFIEILVLFLFGYVLKRSYKLIAFVNLGTQVTITAFLFLFKYFIYPTFGEFYVLFLGEALIFLIETLIYRRYLTEKTKTRAMVYALVANTITLLASFSVIILLMNM